VLTLGRCDAGFIVAARVRVSHAGAHDRRCVLDCGVCTFVEFGSVLRQRAIHFRRGASERRWRTSRDLNRCVDVRCNRLTDDCRQYPNPRQCRVNLMNIASPISFDARGRTTSVDEDRHLRDLIESVLMTAPGERVNRPDFGCGLLQMTFGPGGDQVAVATQALAQSALQRWLGDLIEVGSVTATADDAQLIVTVRYASRRTGQIFESSFKRSTGGAP